MVSSVSNYGSSVAAYSRPDPSQLASKLFSKLDTKGQGYIEESDLQSAFNQVFSNSSSGSSTSSDASSLFSTLDSDSNGQVTESEFSSGMKKLAQALEDQAFGSRMGGMGGMGGMPPPRPDGDGDSDDEGFTKDQLTSQLQEIGSTDSKRTSLISNIVQNFDAADANGDGKVSRSEAMNYEKSNSSSSSSSASSSSSTTSSTSDGSGASSTATTLSEARMMHRLMELMRAYGQDSLTSGTDSTSSSTSTTSSSVVASA